MKAPLALAVGKPTSKGLSSLTGVRELVCIVANIVSTSSFDSSESLFMVSTGKWPNKIDTTFDIVGRLPGAYCTQANPNLMTCLISSSLDLSTNFGSMKSCNASASYSFHACKTIAHANKFGNQIWVLKCSMLLCKPHITNVLLLGCNVNSTPVGSKIFYIYNPYW